MAKRLSKIHQRFSADAKQLRAEEREAYEALRAKQELEMESSILPDDILAPMPDGFGTRVTVVQWEGRAIALISRCENSEGIHLELLNDAGTEMEIQNVEACRSMLTFRRVVRAFHFPEAGVNLAALVRKRDAEAEAEQLRAITGDLPAAATITRL